MELSRIIILKDEYDDLDVSFETVFGVVYLNPSIERKFPWWVKPYGDAYNPIPSEFGLLPTENTVIGIPLSLTAHLYRISVFGQRWIEELNHDVISKISKIDEVHIQGRDYIPDIILMELLQNV